MCSVRRGGSDFTVGVSDSDYRTRTRTVRCRCFSDCRASASFFLLFGGLPGCFQQKRIIVRTRPSFPAGTSSTSNYCSLTQPVPSWVSEFGLHNCSVFYPVLSQHVLCEVCMPGLRSELLFAFNQLDARPNRIQKNNISC